MATARRSSTRTGCTKATGNSARTESVADQKRKMSGGDDSNNSDIDDLLKRVTEDSRKLWCVLRPLED